MLLGTLVVLVAACVSVWLLRARTQGVERDDHLFNNFDIKRIDQVGLQSARDTINLKFNGSRWMVNEQYVADPAMIEVLFATILQAVPKRPASVAQQDSLARALREQGTWVSLQAAGEHLTEFAAGGNAAKTQAYFLRKDQSTPYLMAIPGYRVYVAGIF